MNYELIINSTKEIETILVNLGATGKGLHEKVSSIEREINKTVVKAIRFIATIRNNVLHDDNFKLTKEIISEFEDSHEVVLRMLNIEITKPRSNNRQENRYPYMPSREPELSSFELKAIEKAEPNYIEKDNLEPKESYLDSKAYRYCPNCEIDVFCATHKYTIRSNEYLVKYCITCDFIFSSKKIQY